MTLTPSSLVYAISPPIRTINKSGSRRGICFSSLFFLVSNTYGNRKLCLLTLVNKSSRHECTYIQKWSQRYASLIPSFQVTNLMLLRQWKNLQNTVSLQNELPHIQSIFAAIVSDVCLPKWFCSHAAFPFCEIRLQLQMHRELTYFYCRKHTLKCPSPFTVFVFRNFALLDVVCYGDNDHFIGYELVFIFSIIMVIDADMDFLW